MAITPEFALEQALSCEAAGNEVHMEMWLDLAEAAEKPEPNPGWLSDCDAGAADYLPNTK